MDAIKIRLGGLTRYETAVNGAKEVGTSNGIVLVSGRSFADALSVATVAANLGIPILLTNTNEYNSSNKNFVETNNILVTYVVDEDSVISNSNMKNYKNPVRVGGANRYETNIEILNIFKDSINADKIHLASGMNFPDGLIGIHIAVLTSSPIILMEESENYYPKVLEKIKGIKFNQILISGGGAVVSDNIVNKVLKAVNYEEKSKVLSIE